MSVTQGEAPGSLPHDAARVTHSTKAPKMCAAAARIVALCALGSALMVGSAAAFVSPAALVRGAARPQVRVCLLPCDQAANAVPDFVE